MNAPEPGTVRAFKWAAFCRQEVFVRAEFHMRDLGRVLRANLYRRQVVVEIETKFRAMMTARFPDLPKD